MSTIHTHHEQACAMAAEGYARVARRPALVVVTNGPGVTNVITGVAGAFQDSIPMFIISGQVPTSQQISSSSSSLRQMGVQEILTEPLAKSVSKYYRQVSSVSDLPKIMEEALAEISSGRSGPVWLEIPLDVQNAKVPEGAILGAPSGLGPIQKYDLKITESVKLLSSSERPLIVAGNGVHLSGAETKLRELVSTWKIPVVSTWTASDIFGHSEKLYVGNFGILGQRAANVAIQNADVLLVLGSRLSIPSIGYDTSKFSPNSKVIMVDLDTNEINKETLSVEIPIVADVGEFLGAMPAPKPFQNDLTPWHTFLTETKELLGLVIEESLDQSGYIDSYDFVEALSGHLSNEIVVTDMGTSFTCTMQALRCNGQNRLFTSSGLSSMGFGLPGAIGAWAARAEPVICIAGDGGFLMNLQELQTLVDNKIDLKIFVLNSNGYLAISIMQENSFGGRKFGSDPESGVGAPDFTKVSEAFGVPSFRLSSNPTTANEQIRNMLSAQGPVLCEVPISPNQLMRPRLMSVKNAETGQFESPALDKMWPELPESIERKLEQALGTLHFK
jgi:acetolactate synthase-1/2/3 large subunit